MTELSKDFPIITGYDVDIVSTIDHPYVSPPIRLLSGHSLLLQRYLNGSKIKVINWDLSQPNPRTYRYDTQIDYLLLGKNDELSFFDYGISYSQQKSKNPSTDLYTYFLNLCIKKNA